MDKAAGWQPTAFSSAVYIALPHAIHTRHTLTVQVKYSTLEKCSKMVVDVLTVVSPHSEQDEVYERAIEFEDLVFRVFRNKKMSPVYKMLYLALVDLYPELLQGISRTVNPYKLREHLNWTVSERSVTDFLAALEAIDAIAYDSGHYNKKAEKDEDKRPALITPNAEIFPYPEDFDTKSSEARKKAREDAKQKQQEMRAAWRQYQCDKCGSPGIAYDLTPICKSCGYKHAPVKDVDANQITIAPTEVDELSAMADEYEADSPPFMKDEPVKTHADYVAEAEAIVEANKWSFEGRKRGSK